MRLRSLLQRVTPRRAKLVLEERLRFEALLSELSAGLIHVLATDLDAAFELALQQVGTFLGVDRANLDEFRLAETGIRISWAAPAESCPSNASRSWRRCSWSMRRVRLRSRSVTSTQGGRPRR